MPSRFEKAFYFDICMYMTIFHQAKIYQKIWETPVIFSLFFLILSIEELALKQFP